MLFDTGREYRTSPCDEQVQCCHLSIQLKRNQDEKSFFFFFRFRKFLLWLGTPPAAVRDTKPGTFCRIVSEFALEYRTTRDRVLQQLEKKANHRERNKTRGKMITQINNGYSSLGYDYSSGYQSKEDRADAELRQLLGSDLSDTESMRTGTWGRSRKPGNEQ